MVRGWRNRGHRQADRIGAFPEVPAAVGAAQVGPHTGLYLGSTIAPSWQDRVAVGDYGDRASAEMSLHPEGILIDRSGANPIWIPRSSVTAIRTERGIAGKVMTADGVLVIRWVLPSGTEIDSGVRADDKGVYPQWIREDPRSHPPTPSPGTEPPPDGPPAAADATTTTDTEEDGHP
ncbi:PH-like domain-containing protein [Williamsia deligens]|uniref:Transporter n=1 Tax=Williamsia deligens TaxID=321325 RepID=A0ABW3GB61_9NOCA|nr:transporter [Williamsia deligens]